MVSRDMGRADLEWLTAEEAEASERARDEPLSGWAAPKLLSGPTGRWCIRSG